MNDPIPSDSSSSSPSSSAATSFHETVEPSSNLLLGIAAGAIAAVVGAAAWAAITATTHFQIGWMAVGVGILVGFAVRKFGRGSTVPFGVAGAALALVGCLLGNLFATVAVMANANEAPFLEVAGGLTPEMAVDILKATFSPMDLLFYAIAVYEGYKFAIATPKA